MKNFTKLSTRKLRKSTLTKDACIFWKYSRYFQGFYTWATKIGQNSSLLFANQAELWCSYDLWQYTHWWVLRRFRHYAWREKLAANIIGSLIDDIFQRTDQANQNRKLNALSLQRSVNSELAAMRNPHLQTPQVIPDDYKSNVCSSLFFTIWKTLHFIFMLTQLTLHQVLFCRLLKLRERGRIGSHER